MKQRIVSWHPQPFDLIYASIIHTLPITRLTFKFWKTDYYTLKIVLLECVIMSLLLSFYAILYKLFLSQQHMASFLWLIAYGALDVQNIFRWLDTVCWVFLLWVLRKLLLKVWQKSHPLKFLLVLFGKRPTLYFLHVSLSLTHGTWIFIYIHTQHTVTVPQNLINAIACYILLYSQSQ